MTQQRLNRESGALDLNSIAKEFTQANERQIAFFRPKFFWTISKFTSEHMTFGNQTYQNLS